MSKKFRRKSFPFLFGIQRPSGEKLGMDEINIKVFPSRRKKVRRTLRMNRALIPLTFQSFQIIYLESRDMLDRKNYLD